MVTVDYFSNYWEVDKLSSTTATAVIWKLKSHLHVMAALKSSCPITGHSLHGANLPNSPKHGILIIAPPVLSTTSPMEWQGQLSKQPNDYYRKQPLLVQIFRWLFWTTEILRRRVSSLAQCNGS